jgi:hypothetical protein
MIRICSIRSSFLMLLSVFVLSLPARSQSSGPSSADVRRELIGKSWAMTNGMFKIEDEKLAALEIKEVLTDKKAGEAEVRFKLRYNINPGEIWVLDCVLRFKHWDQGWRAKTQEDRWTHVAERTAIPLSQPGIPPQASQQQRQRVSPAQTVAPRRVKMVPRSEDISFWNEVMPKSRPTTPAVNSNAYEDLAFQWFTSPNPQTVLSLSVTPFWSPVEETFVPYPQNQAHIAIKAMGFAYVGHISVGDIRNCDVPGWLELVKYDNFKDSDLIVFVSVTHDEEIFSLFICTRKVGEKILMAGYWGNPLNNASQSQPSRGSTAGLQVRPIVADATPYRANWNSLISKARRSMPVIPVDRFNVAVKSWLQGYSTSNANTLLSLSSMPFYYDDHVSANESELRQYYTKALNFLKARRNVDAAYVGHISAKDFRNAGLVPSMPALNSFLQDGDLIVSMACRFGKAQDNPYIFMRPQGQQLKIIGFSASLWAPPLPPPPPPPLPGSRPTDARILDPTDMAGDKNMLTLSLSRGLIWTLGNARIRRNELGSAIQSTYQRRANKNLQIMVPRDMPYGELIDVIDTAKGSGAYSFRLTPDGVTQYNYIEIIYFPSTPVPPGARGITMPVGRNMMDFRGYDYEERGIVVTERSIYVGSRAAVKEDLSKEYLAASMRSTGTPFSQNASIDYVCLFIGSATSAGSLFEILDSLRDLRGLGIKLVVKRK